MNEDILWQTKLAARIHDPGEKQLILMRTREGHEGGSVRQLREILGLEDADQSAVRRADWWASAADRPQWPRDLSDRVVWTDDPVLIHPVCGKELRLESLKEIDPYQIGRRSFEHFQRLHERCGGDLKKTLLAFWRFGPEIEEPRDDAKLGELWPQLPADGRVPDHSIWEHLDLVSAFAGAFAADPNGEVALLSLSIGPVQPFIAASRSTSDLWAGSHLLSRLSWETMRPLCEELGPDAVLFPRLRGIPQVDLWLKDQCGLPESLFEAAPWRETTNAEANPLFSAALPNRFVALVPAGQARDLAERCREEARAWIQELGRRTVERLLHEAGEPVREDLYCFEQARRQLAGFPEVHWAVVPFSLIGTEREGKGVVDTRALAEAMAPFYGVEPGQPCGFLDGDAWKVLQREIDWPDGTRFYTPNPGVLYPAVYELAERLTAAAKSVRPFEQTLEAGWRDALTGEVEWLTVDKAQLETSYRTRSDTLWAQLAERRPALAKKGEHLGALSAVKRLWPTLYTEELNKSLERNFKRFVVSTHTMALAHQLDRWLSREDAEAEQTAELSDEDWVALPTRLVRRHRGNSRLAQARRLAAQLDRADDTEDEAEAGRLLNQVKKALKTGAPQGEDVGLEKYYGLLLMDGDRMGALLSGEDGAVTYRMSFHPRIRAQFDQRTKENHRLKAYGDQPRPPSPGRHMAVSGALNDFALYVVPHIVEREYLGRLIYGGGDDVLAMLPVADLLSAAGRLRDAWSGVTRLVAQDTHDSERRRLKLDNGYARLDGRLLRMMGECATASAGLVVAHHKAPLAAVLRELRAAEQRAKTEGGRDAFSITIIKRAGGSLRLTDKWGEPTHVLQELINFLRHAETSRRAVYHSLQWLVDLPEPQDDGAMLADLLAYQLARQSGEGGGAKAQALAERLTQLTLRRPGKLDWLRNFMTVAEFLAREIRSGDEDDGST